MNKLPTHKRVMILNMLIEGMSMRAVFRAVGVSINTVTKMLFEAGEAWSYAGKWVTVFEKAAYRGGC